MDPLIAEVALVGFAAGIVLTATFCSVRIGQLKKRLSAREATIEQHQDRLDGQSKELTLLSDRCSELRVAHRKVSEERDALKPDAERYRAQAAQRKSALEKAMETHRARKAAGNVASIAPKRKRA